MNGSPDPKRRAYWLKTLHKWHWISSAVCLLAMLLFAFTGITLNHASQIEARPRVANQTGTLPAELMRELSAGPARASGKANAALPEALRQWGEDKLSARIDEREAEWSPQEVYLSLPRPGGDAWLRIERDSGAFEVESTDRGWVSYLNDLHKGRHTGVVWSWFIDLFAFACLVFCITGLLILKLHAPKRPSTWPIVGLGLVVPAVLAVVFIH